MLDDRREGVLQELEKNPKNREVIREVLTIKDKQFNFCDDFTRLYYKIRTYKNKQIQKKSNIQINLNRLIYSTRVFKTIYIGSLSPEEKEIINNFENTINFMKSHLVNTLNIYKDMKENFSFDVPYQEIAGTGKEGHKGYESILKNIKTESQVKKSIKHFAKELILFFILVYI